MSKIALFPGTFDPFTNGHLDIIEKGFALFDHIVVGVGVNALKKNMFDLKQRMDWIKACFPDDDRVSVQSYEGLTVAFCKEINASFILRGLRTVADFEYEKQIAMVNSDLHPDVQSIFVLSEQHNTAVSSTVIRDLITHGGDFQRYLPDHIAADIALL